MVEDLSKIGMVEGVGARRTTKLGEAGITDIHILCLSSAEELATLLDVSVDRAAEIRRKARIVALPTLKTPGEVWEELEKIGFKGTYLRDSLLDSDDPWQFVLDIVADLWQQNQQMRMLTVSANTKVGKLNDTIESYRQQLGIRG